MYKKLQVLYQEQIYHKDTKQSSLMPLFFHKIISEIYIHGNRKGKALACYGNTHDPSEYFPLLTFLTV